MPEVLEIRATPGGSLLEVLLGTPLITPLLGSLWADDALLGPSLSVDELSGLTAPRREELAAISRLRGDPAALDCVLGELRSLLSITSADQVMADSYVMTASERIGHVADELASAAPDFASPEFLRDLQWVDELFASIAAAHALGEPSDPTLEGGTAQVGTLDYGPPPPPPPPPPRNLPPVANNDGYAITHDTSMFDAPPGVKRNDYDPEGSPIPASLVSGPSHAASFSFNSDGSFSYAPNYHFVGTDSFTYQISDGQYTDTASVTITSLNQAPVARDDGTNDYHILHDTPINQAAPGVLNNDTDADGDPMTATLVTGPSHAQSFAFNPDGSFSYVPTAQYVGDDSFTYKVSDGIVDSNIATVRINVYNTAPVAEPDDLPIAFEDPNTPIPLYLMANDRDPDGDQPLRITFVSATQEGASVAIDASGGFVWYTLPPPSGSSYEIGGTVVIGEESGGPTAETSPTTDPGGFVPFQDSFTYRISDPVGLSSTDATVHLNTDDQSWITTLKPNYTTASQVGIDGNAGYHLHITDTFGAKSRDQALPGNQIWQRNEITTQLVAIGNGNVIFTQPATIAKGDAVQPFTNDRTPYVMDDELARTITSGYEALLVSEGTEKFLGFNPVNTTIREHP